MWPPVVQLLFQKWEGLPKSYLVSTSISKNHIYPGTPGMTLTAAFWRVKSSPEDLVNIFNEDWRANQFSLLK